MIDFSRVQWIGERMRDPSVVSANGTTPLDVSARSVFVVHSRKFDIWERQGISESIENASKNVNFSRSYGVNFRLDRVPCITISYNEFDFIILSFLKYSLYGYSRVINEIDAVGPPNFWVTFPTFDKGWLNCYRTNKNSIRTLKAFRNEAHHSYFLGTDILVQWEKIPHKNPLEVKNFQWFSSEFCKRFK